MNKKVALAILTSTFVISAGLWHCASAVNKNGIEILVHGNTATKEVALTFDDGPHPDFTPRLLSILKEYDVKATFFLVGKMVARYPNLVTLEAASGHNLGNHTYHHLNLTKISPEAAAEEIRKCGEAIKKVTGQAPHLFRPPGGMYNQEILAAAKKRGYIIVLWDVNGGDWTYPDRSLLEKKLLRRISNGSIILLHDGIPHTMDVLPLVITALKKQGYTFVTIDEMRQHQP